MKNFLFVYLCALLACGIAACSSDNDDTDTTTRTLDSRLLDHNSDMDYYSGCWKKIDEPAIGTYFNIELNGLSERDKTFFPNKSWITRSTTWRRIYIWTIDGSPWPKIVCKMNGKELYVFPDTAAYETIDLTIKPSNTVTIRETETRKELVVPQNTLGIPAGTYADFESLIGESD